MSPNIPYDIQAEIVKRVVPVKSLIRFRSVSKQWKSLIDSSQFIAQHSLTNQLTQPYHLLLIRYKVALKIGKKYVSIIDDDSFPHHKFSRTIPPTVKLLSRARLAGCSHGLVCLYGSVNNREKLIVVWNPFIRKSVVIPLQDGTYTFGFGVCPKTSEPKIVKITCNWGKPFTLTSAEVLTLTSGGWRPISSINLPHSSKGILLYNLVVVDGVIYWVCYNIVTKKSRIISFDLTSEEFGGVDLPDSLAWSKWLSISKLKETLVMLNHYFRGDLMKPACDVWMMLKNGVSKPPSFTKLFSVKLSPCSIIIGFRKNGQPISEQMYKRQNGRPYVRKLEVYEPSSKQMNDLGIYSSEGSAFMMTSYTESLLLLNHSNSFIQ
ncbi:hypothetical protein SSX86_018086 [Deinandra increscens subsp. villosa]|uniref:F-box domain-containing protein n=1 Tax=Deinandra increscens subsp. villosa TaxID=3103831 RepID=A0AAP0CRQ5_9ASTR